MCQGPNRQIQFSEIHPSRSKNEKTMNTNKSIADMKDRKVILSTLWIFAIFNYLYADVFTSFFNPAAQTAVTTNTQGAVLVFAALMETAIAMVLLSRVLKYGVNRWANILVGVLHTVFVAWSLMGEAQKPFYIFFACIEIACTSFIAWYAWKWQNTEDIPHH
jgi:hypothetical protein